MSVIQASMPYLFMHTPFPSRPESTPLRERIAVVGVVVLLHLSLFVSYLLQPEAPAVLVNEMSVSFANMQMQQADVTPQPKPKPREPEPEPLPAEEPAVQEEVQPAPQDTSPRSPVVLDDEPIYSADYLNNPRPSYPLAATRMGYQGRVLLDVEVLADGTAGDVKLLQSSGYGILDNAAMKTVKTWRFVPAHRFGQAVTQWVQIPFRFNLEDHDL